MTSPNKACPECGMPLDMGLSNCPSCGAQVGTVFCETDPVPATPNVGYRQKLSRDVVAYQKIEKAHDHANNSLIMALASFFCPGLGFVMGSAAIFLGTWSLRTLKANNIEESRGPAVAGVVVGSIALMAQICYLIYFLKAGMGALG